MPLAGLVGPLIGAAGAIGGALIGSSGAKSAAQTQANAANQAAQTQMQMYQQTRSDLAPYMTTGNQALSQLASLFGIGSGGPSASTAALATQALTQYPGYQFGFDQGQQALDRSAASRGMVLSGAQLKGAQEFGNNYAMQQAWAPYLAQLNQLGTLGESAAAGVGNAGVTTGQGIAQSQLGAGQATAAGQIGSANAWNNLLQQGSANNGYGLGNLLGPNLNLLPKSSNFIQKLPTNLTTVQTPDLSGLALAAPNFLAAA